MVFFIAVIVNNARAIPELEFLLLHFSFIYFFFFFSRVFLEISAFSEELFIFNTLSPCLCHGDVSRAIVSPVLVIHFSNIKNPAKLLWYTKTSPSKFSHSLTPLNYERFKTQPVAAAHIFITNHLPIFIYMLARLSKLDFILKELPLSFRSIAYHNRNSDGTTITVVDLR